MIDQTKIPCDDFYEFACGNFIKEAVIPASELEIGTSTIARDTLKKRLKLLLEAESEPGEPAVFSSLRKLYSSCMDEKLIEEFGREKILEKIHDLGGWPLLQGKEWVGENFVWQKLKEKAKRMGFTNNDLILNIGIAASPENTAKKIMTIGRPGYLVQTLKYMVDIAVYFGADEKTAKEELGAVIKLDLKLDEFGIDESTLTDMRNLTTRNNLMTIKELTKLDPDYDWLDHINNMLDSTDISLELNETVNVIDPNYFKGLVEYLPTVDVRVIANYMIWNYVHFMIPFTDKKGRMIKFAFEREFFDFAFESNQRWDICYDYFGKLGHAVGSLYVKKYFQTYKKYAVNKLIRNMNKESTVMLNELKWLDDITRKQAQLKLDQMKSIVGYQEEILNNDLLNDLYKGLELNSDHFIKNVLRLNKFLAEYETRMFRKPIDKLSWKTAHFGDVANVGIYYDSSANFIKISVGSLDGDLFQDDSLHYLNYGALGFILGETIIYEWFFSTKEDLLNSWSDEFNQIIECIPDKTQNSGNNTREVNEDRFVEIRRISSHLGLKLAYRAFKDITPNIGRERKLPGLPYTPRKLFWLSTVMPFCHKMRLSKTLNNTALPYKIPVNSSLKNMKEFSLDWNCPAGSPMNPKDRCEIW